jgi:ABC-type nickel/cobalt efflux system permease component RcnA
LSLIKRLIFLVALVLWIVYSKDMVLPSVTAFIVDPTLSYIAMGLITFSGGWVLWRMVLKK